MITVFTEKKTGLLSNSWKMSVIQKILSDKQRTHISKIHLLKYYSLEQEKSQKNKTK